MLCLLAAILSVPAPVKAADSLCATVKIELDQQLTLERQAFNAHIKLFNFDPHP